MDNLCACSFVMLLVCNTLYVTQGIDVKSMGRIFIGLIKCGAWGCFDEFNRLEEAVLSAVSMQIQVIQDAIKQRSPSVELLGRKVSGLLMIHAQIFKALVCEVDMWQKFRDFTVCYTFVLYSVACHYKHCE